MSKYFTMTNFWILVGTIIVCIAPWLALAAIVAFFVAMYFCTPSSPAEPDVGDEDSAIEWPAIEFPNVAAVIDEEKAVAEEKADVAATEEKAVAEARAAAKAEYDEKAKRDFTYFKIAIAPVLVGGILLSNYIDEKKAPVTAQSTQTICVKNADGNTECSYVQK